MNTIDKLYIKGLRLQTTIGCLKWEQQMLQTVVVDLHITIDCKAISEHDSITNALDYATLCDKLTTFASLQNYHLIETLAEKISEFIHEQYPMIKSIQLSLEKPGAISQAQTVGVMIERTYE